MAGAKPAAFWTSGLQGALRRAQTPAQARAAVALGGPVLLCLPLALQLQAATIYSFLVLSMFGLVWSLSGLA